MKDKIHIPKSFLLSGKDLQLTKTIKVKHPTVQEVLDLDKENNGFFSEDIYYSYVSVFLCDPYNYMIYLDDKNIDYETVKPFDLFIMLFNDLLHKYDNAYKNTLSDSEFNEVLCENIYFKAVEFFLGKKYFMIAKDENNNTVVGDIDTHSLLINEDMFELIAEFIRQTNGIQDGDRINPDDEFAKQILIEDERKRLKKLAKKDTSEGNDRLGNLLSAITWASNGSITPSSRNKLHMYDLVDGINRTDKLLSFENIMTGLYSGCVDKKNIDFQKISWQS